MSLHGMGLS